MMSALCARLVMPLAVLSAFAIVPHQSALGQQGSAAIPFPNKTITVTSRGSNIGDVVRNLFGQANLNVKISSVPNCPVHGTFPGTPRQIWEQMAKACNLVAYFDGSAVRVYSATEIKSATIPTQTPASVVREVKRLGWTDKNNIIREAKGAVFVSGTPYFIDNVTRLAPNVSAAALAGPVIAPTVASVPASTDIISPAVTAAISPSIATPRQTAFDRSQLLTSVGPRQPYEVRIFNLRYASAQDKFIKTLRGDVRVKGLETLLRETMGFSGTSNDNVSFGGNGMRGNGVLLNPADPDVSSRFKRDGYAPPQQIIIQEREQKTLDGPSINAKGKKQLVIKDRPEAMRTYAQFIDALDFEKRQIQVEITILEYNTDYNKTLGVSAGVSFGGFSAVIGGPGSEPRGGLGQPNIGGSYTKANGDLVSLTINALERNGWAQVTTRQNLSTYDDEPLFFSDGQELPLSVSANEDAQLYNRFARLGIEAHPRIIDDGGQLRVITDLYIVDGSVTGQNAAGEIIGNTEMNTSMTVSQGESMIIGGLTVVRRFDQKSKVPGLSAVPVLGELFKKRLKGSSRVEKIYIITPRILGTGGMQTSAIPAPAPASLPAATQQGKQPKAKKPSNRL